MRSSSFAHLRAVSLLLLVTSCALALCATEWPQRATLRSSAMLRVLLRNRHQQQQQLSRGSSSSSVPSPDWSLIGDKFAESRIAKQLDSNSISGDARDDVQVIPFTRVRGPTKFATTIFPIAGAEDKFEEGVGPAASFPPTNSAAAAAVEDIEAGDSSNDEIDGDDEDDDDILTVSNMKPRKQSAVQHSELHPVYIKPPVNFKPVLYANRRLDGVQVGSISSSSSSDSSQDSITLPTPEQPVPFKYPNGLTSWLLGGFRGIQRGGYWEAQGSDQALLAGSKRRRYPSLANWRPRFTPVGKPETGFWFMESASHGKPLTTSTTSGSNLLENIELIPLDQSSSLSTSSAAAAKPGNRDAYEASTISELRTLRPIVKHNWRLTSSTNDLMTSASNQNY